MPRHCPAGLTAAEAALWFLEFRTTYDHETGCRLWAGAKTSQGYGHLCYEGRWHGAHRFIKKALHGPPEDPSHHAAHQCPHRACVEPAHIEWQTARANTLDHASKSPSAVNSRKTCCSLCGSALTALWRYCQVCNRERLRKWREENRETHNARARAWAAANLEKSREAGRRYYHKHKESRCRA